MKITSIFCDVHPYLELLRARVEMVSPGPPYDVNRLETFRCPHCDCKRHFRTDFGYFYTTLNEPLSLGDLEQKHRCEWNHEPRYMVLTNVDGLPMFGCPHSDCDVFKPNGYFGGLTMRPKIHGWDESKSDVITEYVVNGLPPGEEAWIEKKGNKWRTLRCTNGVQSAWSAMYETPGDALSEFPG
jgi:hypothetical protein